PKGASVRDVESLFRGTGAIRGAVDAAYYLERVTAPEGEERARISSAKMRKGMAPQAFTVRMTDEHGLELVPEREKAPTAPPMPVTSEERVFAAIVAAVDG